MRNANCATIELTTTPHLPPLSTAYYRGAMGILLVYDVTDEASFNNIRNWMRNIEQHASNNVNRILVGNKSDMADERRAVAYSRGQALANEYGIPFYETSAKDNVNVDEVFMCIAKQVMHRLQQEQAEQQQAVAPQPLKMNTTFDTVKPRKKKSCCSS